MIFESLFTRQLIITRVGATCAGSSTTRVGVLPPRHVTRDVVQWQSISNDSFEYSHVTYIRFVNLYLVDTFFVNMLEIN